MNTINNSKSNRKLNKLYILLSISSELSQESNGLYYPDITSYDIEAYFKSNILLQFGLMGYLAVPFKVLEYVKEKNYAIAETRNECLTKVQLIVSNHFPAKCPVDFSCNILNTKSEFKFKILKYNSSLSALLNDDLVLNTL